MDFLAFESEWIALFATEAPDIWQEKAPSQDVYLETSLAEARVKRDEARKLIAQGMDPSQARWAGPPPIEEAPNDTFERVAREWHPRNQGKWLADHAR